MQVESIFLTDHFSLAINQENFSRQNAERNVNRNLFELIVFELEMYLNKNCNVSVSLQIEEE